MLVAAEFDGGLIYVGGRWDFVAKVWESKADGIPFDITPYTVTMTIGEGLTLVEGDGLTVTPGHEKEGETPAAPTVIEANLSKAQTAALKSVSSIHYTIALGQEVEGEDEPDFLLRGDLPVVIP